jgi:hypothetical protein
VWFVSFCLGPPHDRWTPGSWQDVIDAAASGVLDERQWVELKQAVPPGKGANLELARDLAALAVDGGLLIIGVRDDSDQPGAVVGTPLAGLADRVDQVSRDRVHPPLVVRPVEIADPVRADHGCVLVIVDASPEAPHMVDGRYWGRGATGKRVLSDADVRRLFELNSRRREDFQQRFRSHSDTGPLAGPGSLHVLLSPRAGRAGALAELVDAPYDLLNLIARSAPADPTGWRLDHLTDSRRRVQGVEISNVDLATVTAAGAASTEYNLIALALRDDGQIGLTVTGMVGEQQLYGQTSRYVATTGVVVLTRQLIAVAARLADLAGYGGTWDAGLAITDLRGVRPLRSDGFGRARLYGSAFPDRDYSGTTAAATGELTDQSLDVLARMTRPLLRVLVLQPHLSRF